MKTDWKKKYKKLKKEYVALEDKITRLEFRLDHVDQREPLIEAGGVKWKKAADGSIEPIAYCGECELVMTPFPSDCPEHLACTQCGAKSTFALDEMEQVISSILDA